jgi:hypothetical protein
MASILNATTSSGLVTSADNSGSLQLATNNGTTAVTIDTSQNVGIGTTSPISNGGYGGLSLNGTSGALFSMMTNGTESGRIASLGDETSVQCKASTGYINFVQGVSGGTVRGRFDSAGNFQYNSGYGSVATAYGCRAWVNFNGTGTVAIRASGNVSSITDNATGDYFVNYTNAMPDANSSVVGTTRDDVGTNAGGIVTLSSQTSSAARVLSCGTSGTQKDFSYMGIVVLR